MVGERINYDFANAAFYSAQDFILCWDAMEKEVEDESDFTDIEKEEVLSNYRAEAVEYIYQFCVFVNCQVIRDRDEVIPANVTTLTELTNAAMKKDTPSANDWTRLTAVVDRIHSQPAYTKSYGQREFYELLVSLAPVAARLVKLSLTVEELTFDD